jgi:molybdopterin-guanine dinucleotide biosynthesis protein A
MSTPAYDAIVLAGGRALRLGGQDKTRLAVGDRSILDRVLDALPVNVRAVIVGERRPTARHVVWCREEPPGSGPAAAVAAGLEHVAAPMVLLLAGDLPLLTAEVIELLVADLPVDGDGIVLLDAESRPQWLVSAWRTGALRAAPLMADGSLHHALRPLRWIGIAAPDGSALLDCDTTADLARAREVVT